jgi:hypothetical protein
MPTFQEITLVSGATTITLPGQMLWPDRRAYNLVAQQRDFGANGSQIIEEWQQQGGFPITLVAGGAGDTWVTEDVVDALRTLAGAPLVSPMTLTYNDGSTYSVRFRYQDNNSPVLAVEANPIRLTFPSDATVLLSQAYSLTLRLLQAIA